ncbi:GerMN domain-containing protein [bacterium]|nr:GerMN domain-containing protein [bacterium]
MIKDDLGRKIMTVLLAFFIIIVGIMIIYRWIDLKEKEEGPRVVKEVPGEIRTLTLFFANSTADGLLSETRDITSEGGLENEVKQAIVALLAGPEDKDKVSAIPNGTEISSVFWAENKETIYLDFSEALVSNHMGGSAGEYYTIKTILKTVGVNFPQVAKVQFLVSGYPVNTIAGHYKVDSPLSVKGWR